jgi:hypothetical protein
MVVKPGTHCAASGMLRFNDFPMEPMKMDRMMLHNCVPVS